MKSVVGQAALGQPTHRGCADGAAEGVRTAEPGVVDENDQHVGDPLGRRDVPNHRPVADRLGEGAPGGATKKTAVGDRQPSAVRVDSVLRFSGHAYLRC